jgi:outer membrane receptor protein involved in Fe transport
LPTFGDLYLRAGGGATPNPDLRPERVVIDGEVGAAYEPGRGRVRLTGATFFRHTRDPIIWLPSVVAVWSPINAGRLTAYGVETGLSVLLFPGLVLETNATVQSSRLGFEGYSNPLPYHPALSGGVALERSGAGPGVRLDLELEGARRTSVYGPHELPAVALLDLRANQGFRAVGVDAVIEIGLLNVLDVAYERVELFPEPGRTVEVRLSVRPGATPTLQAYRAGRSLRSPRQNR